MRRSPPRTTSRAGRCPTYPTIPHTRTSLTRDIQRVDGVRKVGFTCVNVSPHGPDQCRVTHTWRSLLPPPRSLIVTTDGSTASRRERCLDPALPSVFWLRIGVAGRSGCLGLALVLLLAGRPFLLVRRLIVGAAGEPWWGAHSRVPAMASKPKQLLAELTHPGPH